MARKLLTGVDLNGQKAVNAADGSAATDLVTVQQLQAAIRGLDWKDSVRVAVGSNVSLTAPGATLDGVTMANGDRVLLMGQTTGAENGIYVFNGSAATLTRAVDADSNVEVTSGMATTATEGTTYGDKAWILITDGPIVLGTTALSFTQLGGAGASYTAGNGLQLSANAFSIKLDTSPGLLVTASGIKIDPTYSGLAKRFAAAVPSGATTATIAHGLGTADVVVQLILVATGEVVDGDVVVNSTNIVLTFPTAPTTNQYRVIAIA
jgi:hypothetical protein